MRQRFVSVNEAGWEIIACNCATVTGTDDKNVVEERIKHLSEVVKLKCGFEPNKRIALTEDRILIGYVEDGNEQFDPKRFGRFRLFSPDQCQDTSCEPSP